MMSLRYLIKVLLFVMGILLTAEAMNTRSCKGKSPMVPISEEDADLASLRDCSVMPANADDDVGCPAGSLRLMARTIQGVEEAVMYAVPVLENVRVTPDVNYRVWLGQPYMRAHLQFWIDMFERARGMEHNQLAPLPMADDYTPPRENATDAEMVDFVVERFQVSDLQ
jgi:hypothetical protein